MKKTGLINSGISAAIAGMGHTDSMTVCDSGLPIPQNVQRIDLALVKGVPTFIETVEAVLLELKVEEIIIAEEFETVSPAVCASLLEAVEKSNGNVKITKVAHEDFKKLSETSKAIIRTGEFTPYANVILKSGVVF